MQEPGTVVSDPDETPLEILAEPGTQEKKEDDENSASLPASITTEAVIEGYFKSIDQQLLPFEGYRKSAFEIDFLKLRRFLTTAYNNLTELDWKLNTDEITAMHGDLESLCDIYDEFRQRALHVKKAFYELFLNNHDEFVRYRQQFENNKESIKRHDNHIMIADAGMKKLEHIGKTMPKENVKEYAVLIAKMKQLRAKLIDSVHNKRSLEDENLILAQYITMIIQENEESFRHKFLIQSERFDKKIVTLLNKTAYTFDVSLWKEARHSSVIKRHFEKLQIKGNISSLTYLRYYLQSLSRDKLTEENKALFQLLPYLESLERRSIVYLSDDLDTSLKIRKILTSLNMKIDLKIVPDVKRVYYEIQKTMPQYIFSDYSADYRSLIKMLRRLGVADDVTLVLLADQSEDIVDERAKQFHIDRIIGIRTPSLQLTQKFVQLFE